MSDQTKCPFCGAGKAMRDFVAVHFDCLTSVPHEHPKSARFQSAECRAKARLDEIDRLRERLALLQRIGNRMAPWCNDTSSRCDWRMAMDPTKTAVPCQGCDGTGIAAGCDCPDCGGSGIAGWRAKT